MWFRRCEGGMARGREGSPAAPAPRNDPSVLHPRALAPSRPHARLGFTLIELLVVITVLAILASLVSPMVFRNVGDAKVTAAKAQLEIFSLALDSYRLDNDYYPSTAQGLNALVAIPVGEPRARNWRGPYLKRGIPNDPWGLPYLYRSPPSEASPDAFEILSFGRDGKTGGTGEDVDLSTSDPVKAAVRR